MGAWTHHLCDACWAALKTGHPEPVRLLDDAALPCCKCGASSSSGIYVRAEPGKWPHCIDGAHRGAAEAEEA